MQPAPESASTASTPMTAPGEDDVIARRQGRIGRLLLNRPRALNALSLGMIEAIGAALAEWRDDPAVHAVVVEGAGGRAYCSGGDIRAMRALATAGDTAGIRRYFTAEYGLNRVIAEYPKPYVALVDGICMGGGLGVAMHGAARVATEAALFAMPETGIGFLVDVGASHVLPRLRGAFGMYMALTGARVGGADAVYLGLATHFTARERLATLADEMAEDGVAVLADAAMSPPPGALPGVTDAVRRCFGADSVAEILRRLEAEGTDWARETLEQMRAASPSAVLWTFELVRAGAGRTLAQALTAELALTGPVTSHPDFAEGVRAMVVDKDRTPRWSPARIEDVDPAAIRAMFA